MSGLVRRTLTERYDALWEGVPEYAQYSPGEDAVPFFLQIAHPTPGATVLDAGCGSGKGALALRAHGLKVTLSDLTTAGVTEDALSLPFMAASVWSLTDLPTFDFVYCTDVLEHLPPEWTMLAVAQMLQHQRRGLFLTVGLEPDAFGVWVGTPLHETVRLYEWWWKNLQELATVVDARDRLTQGMFFLRT